MGAFNIIFSDIKDLVNMGYTDKEISLSVGIELSLISFIISYYRKETNIYIEGVKSVKFQT